MLCAKTGQKVTNVRLIFVFADQWWMILFLVSPHSAMSLVLCFAMTIVSVISEGRTFLVAVPVGGAMAGTQFTAIVIGEQGSPMVPLTDPHNIPNGAWRDGLW